MGEEDNVQRIVSLLGELRDNQRQQIERQTQALALQREQFAIVQRQYERAERLQDRAEAIQAKSAHLVKTSRRAVAVVLPILLGLLVYLSWLIFRH